MILLINEKHKKTRDESLSAATNLSRIISDKGGLVGLFNKLLAGLAAKSQEFKISTLVLIGRLLYEHHATLAPEFIMEITNVIVLVLKDQDTPKTPKPQNPKTPFAKGYLIID